VDRVDIFSITFFIQQFLVPQTLNLASNRRVMAYSGVNCEDGPRKTLFTSAANF